MAGTKHIVAVVGTRPEAIKMAPIVRALRATDWARCTLLVTAQHRALLDSALAPFDLKADVDLDLMTADQTLAGITGRAFLRLEEALARLQPDCVLAQGDTTTVMATATTCFYMRIKFGHVEAGLRTGNIQTPFPEEFNRVVAGLVADLHFAPTTLSAETLTRSGVAPEKIFVTGNTVIDALLDVRASLAPAPPDRLGDVRTILLTAHRRENFGEPLRRVLAALRRFTETRADVRVVYPVHPNPNVRKMAQDVFGDAPAVSLIEPLSYPDFVRAMEQSYVIVTDSGGVQEEAPALGKPVLVLRRETERPEAISFGVAELVGVDPHLLTARLTQLFDDSSAYRAMAKGASPYGDGKAAARIVDVLRAQLSS